MLKKCLVAICLLMVFGIWLHSSFGLPYVFRVMVYQDAGPDDFLWKPRFQLQPAENTASLVRSPKEDAVQSAFTKAGGFSSLDDFMAETDASALLVVQNGALIYERYYNAHAPDDPIATFSISKSVFSVILGRLAANSDGLDLSEHLVNSVPELAGKEPSFDPITLGALLDMRSGLGFENQVAFPFYNQDKPLVYYATDLRSVLTKRPQVADPVGTFRYNDYGPNLLALALERQQNIDWQKLVQSQIWDVIGAEHPATWSTDNTGFPLVESGLAAVPVDLARFGYAVLENSDVTGANLLPQHWHHRSTHLDASTDQPVLTDPDWYYRNLWWMMPHTDATLNVAAIGNLGQFVFICPSKSLVVVRTGTGKNGMRDRDFTNLFGQFCALL